MLFSNALDFLQLYSWYTPIMLVMYSIMLTYNHVVQREVGSFQLPVSGDLSLSGNKLEISSLSGKETIGLENKHPVHLYLRREARDLPWFQKRLERGTLPPNNVGTCVVTTRSPPSLGTPSFTAWLFSRISSEFSSIMPAS